MNIKKSGDNIIITLPFWQNKNNPYDERENQGRTHNLVCVIAEDDLTISQLNDLSYKDAQQEGAPLVHYYESKEKFVALCKELELNVWEHELCAYCGKVIYGAATFGDKGFQCFECENKK